MPIFGNILYKDQRRTPPCISLRNYHMITILSSLKFISLFKHHNFLTFRRSHVEGTIRLYETTPLLNQLDTRRTLFLHRWIH